mmetsp:Transcript_91258/g.254115  ORF Transcript_91258/g.254115 Transcript_91258/m.254115 type:complete len:235 (-) Transcript_91258:725-1429(-)
MALCHRDFAGTETQLPHRCQYALLLRRPVRSCHAGTPAILVCRTANKTSKCTLHLLVEVARPHQKVAAAFAPGKPICGAVEREAPAPRREHGGSTVLDVQERGEEQVETDGQSVVHSACHVGGWLLLCSPPHRNVRKVDCDQRRRARSVCDGAWPHEAQAMGEPRPGDAVSLPRAAEPLSRPWWIRPVASRVAQEDPALKAFNHIHHAACSVQRLVPSLKDNPLSRRHHLSFCL